jgi:tRNA pseudouridine38-40 synthase
MRRVAVKIGYLGEGFTGSQIQPGHRTVEGEVLSNLMTLGHDENDTDLKCASRTDKGVNALGNVIVFNTSFHDSFALLKALNSVSDGVFYRSVAEVRKDFNPRHADMRIYHYVLPKAGIDVHLATQCAALFEGRYDFIRFCRPEGRSAEMNMRSVRVEEKEHFLVIEFVSEFFLWNLIRRIVSAISSVGRGTASLNDVERALNGEDLAFGIARPDALTLTDVHYKDIEFRAPEKNLDIRAEEELFRMSLRMAFFDSL